MLSIFHGRVARRRTPTALPNKVGLAGALAGLGGGLAMALIGALLSHALDQDQWLQLKVIASLVLGPTVTEQTGFTLGPIVFGALIHLAVAALLGALFQLVLQGVARLRSGFGAPEVAGLAYGLLIWLVAYFVVIPIVCPQLLQIFEPALILQHLVYGAITGLLYALLRP